MAEFIRVSQVKEYLTECPICHHEYDEVEHLPLRMPCCLQPVCHSCLQEIWDDNKLRCPLCRHEHELPDGVASLPVESLMFKILDHLKIQKGLRLPCTDCPDGNEAQFRCDDCSIFLCEECHRAHARSRSTRGHKTVNFDEMKGRPVESFRKLHQCKEHQQTQQFFCHTCDHAICVSCTVVNHDKLKGHDVVSVDEAHQQKAKETDDVLIMLDKKVARLEQKVTHLEKKKTKIQISRQRATEDINRAIDNLIELLKTRRTSLLIDVDMKSEAQLNVTDEAIESTTTLLAKVKSSTEYTREMRERADKVEDLQLMVSSTDTLKTMLQEKAKDVKFDRTGVIFDCIQVTEIKALLDVLGSIRTVTFSPEDRPPYAQAGCLYNAVSITPCEAPQVTGFDHVFSDGALEFISPHLEFDHNTASADVHISEGMVSNNEPDPGPQDTGCRLQSQGRLLSLRPIFVKRGEVVVFSSEVELTVKELEDNNMLIWEIALTSSPRDTYLNQSVGLSMLIRKCLCHKQKLCFLVWYDDNLLCDIPLIQYEVGGSCKLHFATLINRDANTIHIVNVTNAKVVKSITWVEFEKPHWVLMHVGEPSKTLIKSQLISGQNLMSTAGFKQLLSSTK